MGAGFTAYGETEKEIIRRGLPAVEAVLLRGGREEKLRLLLALDWFMDPYFRQDTAAMADGLCRLLQTAAVSSGDTEVSEAALGLLTDYCWPPFPILEAGLESVPAETRGEALYAVRMDRED